MGIGPAKHRELAFDIGLVINRRRLLTQMHDGHRELGTDLQNNLPGISIRGVEICALYHHLASRAND
jgi:hypothetical protein